MSPQQKVLNALRQQQRPLTAPELRELTGLWTSTLYPTLIVLENSGRVTSKWQDGPSPRNRLYSLPQGEE